MAELIPLTRAGKLLDLAGEVEMLQALAGLAEHWRDIAAKFSGIHSAPELFDLLVAGIADDNVKAAFEAAGLQELYSKLVGLGDRLSKLPPEYRLLLTPVDELVESASDAPGRYEGWLEGTDKGLIDWTPLTLDQGVDGEKLGWSLGASATLQCEGGALWPFRSDAVQPGLTRIGASATLEAKGKRKFPFPQGSLTAGAGAGGTASIDYFFRPKTPERIFAAELADAALHLADPFDLDAVWRAFALGRLEGLILAFNGSAEVKVEVAVGRDVEIPEILNGRIGLTAEVGVRRTAQWTLSVLRAGSSAMAAPTLALTLSRDKAAVRNWAAGIGLEVDIAPLIKRIQKAIEPIIGKWDDALEKIKPYLTPGTWIQEKATGAINTLLGQVIADPKLLSAVSHDLALATGQSADGDGLAQLLQDQLVQSVSKISGIVTGTISEKSSAIIAELSSRLPAFARDELQQTLQAQIEALLTEFQTELDGQVRGVFGELGSKKFRDALERAGAKVSGAIENADKAVAEVRTIIGHVDETIHAIAQKLKEAAKTKISARLAVEETRISENNFEVRAALTAPTAESRRLYHSIAFGDLQAVQKLFGGNDVPGFVLDRGKSSIRRFAKVSRTLGYEFILLGLEVSARDVLTASAEVVVTGNGDVRVEGDGEFDHVITGLGASRSASFSFDYSLLLAKAEANDGSRPAELQLTNCSISASHRDKNLKRGEVSDFLARLDEFKLLSPDRRQAAEKWAIDLAGSMGGDAKLAVDITVTMKLDGDATSGLISVGRALQAKDSPTERSVFGLGVAALRRTDAWSDTFFDWSVERCRDAKPDISRQYPDPVDFLFAIRGDLPPNFPTHGAPRPEFNIVHDKVGAAMALIGLLKRMAKIYDAEPQQGPDGPGWDSGRYADELSEMAEKSQDWLFDNSKFVFWFKRDMHPQTIAFFLVMAWIAQGVAETQEERMKASQDSLMSLVLTRRSAGEGLDVPVNL